MKIVSVVGNRPQFIKSAPLSLALREAKIDEVVVHTGQHYDRALSEVFFEELRLAEPQHRLDLRTADPEWMEPALAETLFAEDPDLVLVYGDTNSTLAGARAAVEAGIPLVHVEAGLRSGDLEMPEERARIEVDRMAALLLCPDERSAATLAEEGVQGEIQVVGDVMADSARRFAPIARKRFPIAFEPRSYVLATVHREANVFQPRLGRIIQGLNQVRRRVLFPTHPRTRYQIRREKLRVAARVQLLEPLGYLELASLASQAHAVVTDSGGLQKEAYWYRVPCVTLRPSTEWVDTVRVGANVLVDDDPDAISDAVDAATMPKKAPPLYGDGHAAERIAKVLLATMRGR
jgi:UDP-N-acetylglucosamine 2-epimerase